MSVGSLGSIANSSAGSPLAQTKGTEIERSQQEAGVQQHAVQSDRKAESAAGVGETDGQDHEAAERDANGRRSWEAPPGRKEDAAAQEAAAADPLPRTKDLDRQSGNQLDLMG